MDTDTIDRLFLELSQVTKATTGKELALLSALKEANDITRSFNSIIARRGKEIDGNWEALQIRVEKALLNQHSLIYGNKPASGSSA